MWQPVGNTNIVRDGTVWSSADLDPTPDDYKAIAELSGGGRLTIVHDLKRSRIFDVEFEGDRWVFRFVGAGELFASNAPRFSTGSIKEYLMAVSLHCDEVYTLHDAAKILFPMYYRIGTAKRIPEKYNMEFTESENHPNWDDWDWYDYTAHARDITSTLTHRAYKEGWVKRVGVGKWSLNI